MEGTTSLLGVPFMVENIIEYQQYFGLPYPETGLHATVDDSSPTQPVVIVDLDEPTRSPYLMYYSLQLYFANGGAPCYILSVGLYKPQDPVILVSDFKPDGTTFCPQLEKYNDITLVVIPDAMSIAHTADPDKGASTYYALWNLAIDHCIEMGNRMAVLDVYPVNGHTLPIEDIKVLRGQDANNSGISVTGPLPENFKYAAAYYPRIYTTITPSVKDPTTLLDRDDLIKVSLKSAAAGSPPAKLSDLKAKSGQIYYAVKNYISNNLEMLLPAAPGVVGVYATVDNLQGVWTAPANWPITAAVDLKEHISAKDQGPINVDPVTGMSVNVIRNFPGRGPAVIWGARTLAGNDNEWRYISVRRFFFMVEQSVKNAMEPLVFASNDNNTWSKVKAMIGNYLTGLWKQGALMGNTAKESFYVHVGLGETMVETDIWEGRMIVQIGMAVVRPAEFIILQFMQMMQSPS